MAGPTNVTFKSFGIPIAGHLYRPDEGSPDRHGAAVVIGHPFTAVKEQTSGMYAKALAAQGFFALAYDAAYGGESGGEPRGLENPMQRAEDARAAVTYLCAQEEIDSDRIGALGICASGGYFTFAAQTDTRMRAVATISAMCAGRSDRQQTPKALRESLDRANKDRVKEHTGEARASIQLFEEDPVERKKQINLMQEGWEYYRQPPMMHPRAPNNFLASGTSLSANFDSFRFNNLISPRPLLMIAGSKAETAPLSEEGIALAEEPKELYIIEGKTHIDLYKDTTETVPKLVEFYSGYLCAQK